MKIIFYTTSLGGGGAEKHLQRIANVISRNGATVTVAVARGGGGYEDHLSEEVRLTTLTDSWNWLNSSTWQLMRSVPSLRHLLSERQPDIVCGVMDRANVRLMRAVRGLPHNLLTVLCVQNDPQARFEANASLRKRLLLWRMKRQYKFADKIISISEGVKDSIIDIDLIPENKTSVIYNAGFDKEVIARSNESLDCIGEKSEYPIVVACGRLTKQKGFKYLVRAFSKVVEEHRDASLWILGEGKEEGKLKKQVNRLGLARHVSFLGFRDNPFKFMRNADVFALSSLWEGFGNVIVEAMACKTPVVATNCPSGPAEIITHERHGLLVPPADSEMLGNALCRILADDDFRNHLARNAEKRAKDFHADTIGKQYLDLFEELIETSEGRRPLRSY